MSDVEGCRASFCVAHEMQAAFFSNSRALLANTRNHNPIYGHVGSFGSVGQVPAINWLT